MQSQRLLGRGIAALSGAGLLLNLLILYVHRQLDTHGGSYTSFCNVSAEVNCDAVLGSGYATLLGLPVAAWGALTYAAMVVLSLLPGVPAALALLALAGWAAGYSAVMAAVSVGVLQTICLMCSGLYVVVAGLVVLSLLRVLRTAGARGALTAGVLPAVLGVAFGYVTTAGMSANAPMSGLADVRAREPDFYRWYLELPVAAEAREIPAAPAHAKGLPAAPVTIVEYSDFACSHCARARQDLDRLLSRRPDDVRLVFRHFPLDTSCNPTLRRSVHPRACEAAVAAECAGELGKFWEFHDYLFDNQETHDYVAAARALGLDAEQFQSCLRSGRGRAAVARDVAAASSLGVESTPTLFFNGRVVRGALDGHLYEVALLIERDEQIDRGPGGR
jgi:protein-disulfide isomerase/uncharacterized membrane protein